MGEIEELPDDFDESLNLNKPEQPPSPKNETPKDAASAAADAAEVPFPINKEKVKPADPMAPELPPAMASVRSYTADELADMMNKTPLFMTDLDKAGDEGWSSDGANAVRLGG